MSALRQFGSNTRHHTLLRRQFLVQSDDFFIEIVDFGQLRLIIFLQRYQFINRLNLMLILKRINITQALAHPGKFSRVVHKVVLQRRYCASHIFEIYYHCIKPLAHISGFVTNPGKM